MIKSTTSTVIIIFSYEMTFSLIYIQISSIYFVSINILKDKKITGISVVLRKLLENIKEEDWHKLLILGKEIVWMIIDPKKI